MNASIEIEINTVAPLHISAPEKGGYDTKTGKFAAQTGNGSFPATLTRKITLAEMIEKDTEEKTRARVSIPLIPANTLRGGLRRQIAQIYFEHIENTLGKKLSLDAFHVLTCGAPNGRPDGSFTSIKDIQRYRSDMYFGLLGGGPKLGAASQLKVRNGYPVCPATTNPARIPLVVPKLLNGLKSADTDWLTHFDPIPHKDDASLNHASKAAISIVDDIDNAVEAFDSESKKKTDKGKGKTDDFTKDTSLRGLNTLSFIEYILPKTPMFLRFDVVDGQEKHIGLLMLGLQRLLQQPLGGKSGIGMGQIAITKIAVKVDDEVSVPQASAPELWDEWFAESGVVGRCVQAAKDDLAQTDVGEIEELCMPAKK
jgi:CRISPR type IV-associated protein Csf2